MAMMAATSPVVGYLASNLMTASSPCNMPMCEKCRGIVRYIIVHKDGIEQTYYGCCGTDNHVSASHCKQCGKTNEQRWCTCNFWDTHSPDTWLQSVGGNAGIAVGVPVAYTYGIPLGMQCGTAIIGGTLGATIGMVLIPAMIVVQCHGQGVNVGRKTERLAGEACDAISDRVNAVGQAIDAGGQAAVQGAMAVGSSVNAGVGLVAGGVNAGGQAIVASGQAAVQGAMAVGSSVNAGVGLVAGGVNAGGQAIVASGQAAVQGAMAVGSSVNAGVGLVAGGVNAGGQKLETSVAAGEAPRGTSAQLPNESISDEEVRKIAGAVRSNTSLVKDRSYWGMTYKDTVCGGPGGIVEWLSSTEVHACTKEQALSICQRLVGLNLIQNTNGKGGPFVDDDSVWFEFVGGAPSSQNGSYWETMGNVATHAASMANDAAEAVANNENVQSAVQATKETVAAVAEDDTFQAVVKATKETATAVAESENVQAAVQATKETATAIAENETVQLLAEQTVEGFYAAKDRTVEAAQQAYDKLEELAADEAVQSTLSSLCGKGQTDLSQHVVPGSLPKYYMTDQVVLVNTPGEERP